MGTLWRVLQSMRLAADEAGVQLVTGDTKVVDRGHADRIFVNTTGIGVIEHELSMGPQSVQPGDAILLSGDIGRHGIAIMAVREGLEFGSDIVSDCAPLRDPVMALLGAGIGVHCLRDLTRGGLASALVEIAEASDLHLGIDERSIEVGDEVRGACELLGLDPLHVANEGRFVAFVPPHEIQPALSILQSYQVSAGAGVIGQVSEQPSGLVTMKSMIGPSRIVDMLSGEQLPRIC
jgi:hydrogenase expression/formation protein HypE